MSDILKAVYSSALDLHNADLISDEVLGEFKLLCENEMSNICQKIEELKGTCNSINIDDFTAVELQLLDEEIFECEQCNWWCELNEMSEHIPMTCTDCADKD